ncbi:DPOLM polymerase, partial [Atractosteus spatula]|nr:DPOLM polymerase [Atractosteus spatula]
SMVPLKRRKTVRNDVNCERNEVIKFPDVVIFLLERKMGASRRAFLTRLGRNKGFRVEDCYSDAVTHVVSENNMGDEVVDWLDRQIPGGWTPRPVHLLDISWFTESMGAARPLDVQDAHRLKVKSVSQADGGERTVSPYACRRRTPLQHHNRALTVNIPTCLRSVHFCVSDSIPLNHITLCRPAGHLFAQSVLPCAPGPQDALEVLAENAEFCDSEGRSLAFRKAASVLKALPLAVRSVGDLQGVPCLGEHSLGVIKEILEDGLSREVEAIVQSERYQAMKTLTGIFGVGVKTADRWFREGVRNPSDLLTSGRRLTREQEAGVLHYEDLSTPITREEAHAIGQIVEEAVHTVLPGAELTITGGFRRGKKTGHDVDFLITHPEEGKEVGLLPKVISWLDSQDLLLYHRVKENTYLESKVQLARSQSSMDRFERCFSIFRLKPPEPGASSGRTAQESAAAGGQCSGEPRSWKAVRVDLVVTPVSQFAFGLLGWTGSQHFERELRRWAGQEKHMSLNSHALYDRTQSTLQRAKDHRQTIATSMASNGSKSGYTWDRSPVHHRAHTLTPGTDSEYSSKALLKAIASHEKGEIQAHMLVVRYSYIFCFHSRLVSQPGERMAEVHWPSDSSSSSNSAQLSGDKNSFIPIIDSQTLKADELSNAGQSRASQADP